MFATAPRIVKILHVEDNMDHAYLFRTILEQTWPEVDLHHEGDGLKAINYLTTPGLDQPDLVVLDINLPGMNGLDILGTIKFQSELRHIPVVILSTSDSAFNRDAAYSKYANSYLVKPVDPKEFRKMVSDLYHYWICINQTPDD